ncbi:SDR family NAD(P)-dependent oxidoreductase [Tessaracoccus sp. G1721]
MSSNTWAVVTGASSGLGVGYAQRLASEGVNVLLVARRRDLLESVAETIRSTHGVAAEVWPADLTIRDERSRLAARMAELDVSHLVNNAGFGTMGHFKDASPDRVSDEMELNMVALTELTRAVLPHMVGRGAGAIINVASTAAFQPIPTMAVYAASKAYVMRFTIALWEELYSTGVRAIVICPGPTDTEFFANAGDDGVMKRRRTIDQVVETTFAGLKAHRPMVVDGPVNALMAAATRLVPMHMQARVARLVATN